MPDMKPRTKDSTEEVPLDETELYKDPHYIKYIVSEPLGDCRFVMDTGREITAVDLTVAVSLIMRETYEAIQEHFPSPEVRKMFREALTRAVNDERFWEEEEAYFLS
ncbi:MAG: hypothetical protein E7188_02095 [Erysipelotrichaceae bacterium]|nr:hypothetical protein [Erysipelotrichaceae bacterium]MBQ2690516.1 hypothetical protein [Solobacterium sp.]MBQ6592084.1 hypothetical protein [Solobacterium sp.]